MVPADKVEHVSRLYDAIYPRHYIAYRAPSTSAVPSSPAVTIDGDLNKPFWNDVDWSEDFVDIATETAPKFRTKVKMRCLHGRDRCMGNSDRTQFSDFSRQ
mmetsp:Transcript_35538/g.74924  ORF Transcript_35538/g.74924 Transcript_35538/m.74924 type:complete len:101 (+) Transcript_35538:97-399(+)